MITAKIFFFSRKASSPEPDLTGFDENLDDSESDVSVLDSSIPELSSQMQKNSALSKLEKSIVPKAVMITKQEVESDIENSSEVIPEKEETTPPSKSNLHVSFHTPSFLNSSKDDDDDTDDSIRSPVKC